MAGSFPNNSIDHDREQAIDTWMVRNVENRGYERYDDLHIDQIDPTWEARRFWIEGAAKAFQLATILRDHHKFDFTVVIAFSLVSGEEATGVDFQTLDELATKLDSSPPSLYLFERGKEPRTETGVLKGEVMAQDIIVSDIKMCDLEIFGSMKFCYYMEFKQAGVEEYSRTVFVES